MRASVILVKGLAADHAAGPCSLDSRGDGRHAAWAAPRVRLRQSRRTSGWQRKEQSVFWHILRYDMSHRSEADRLTVEQQLNRLIAVDEVRWLLVGRHVDDDQVVGAVVALDDADALARYRVHPTHVAAAGTIKEAGGQSVRLDLVEAANSAAWPSGLPPADRPT
jgi:hypothetical protein